MPDLSNYARGLQEHPKLEAAVRLHGGMVCSSSQRDAADRSCTLIVTDVQKADLGSAALDVTNLHITTVDHILVSAMCLAFSGFFVCLVANVRMNVITPLLVACCHPDGE